jgi:hypothetical protein
LARTSGSGAANATFAAHDPESVKPFKPDFSIIWARLKQPVIFDGRNLFEPGIVFSMGIEYHGIGRESELTGN